MPKKRRSGSDQSTLGPQAGSGERELDFGEVKGLQHVECAVEVAVANGQNIPDLSAGDALQAV